MNFLTPHTQASLSQAHYHSCGECPWPFRTCSQLRQQMKYLRHFRLIDNASPFCQPKWKSKQLKMLNFLRDMSFCFGNHENDMLFWNRLNILGLWLQYNTASNRTMIGPMFNDKCLVVPQQRSSTNRMTIWDIALIWLSLLMRIYRQTSNIRHVSVSNKNCLSLRCSRSIAFRRCSNYILDATWFQYIAQRQLQDETRNN